MKEKIKTWYKWGLWTKTMVQDAVKNSVIAPEEYELIIGETYND